MAEVRARAKRATDLLDDKVKARLRGDDCRLAGYVSSGSEHEGGELSGFVDGFFFSDDDVKGSKGEDADAGSEGEGAERSLQRPVPVVAMVRDLLKASASEAEAELPRVYVGKPEELRRLLRPLAEAAKRSLLAREMHVPPWRKGRYMQAKWLGPYRRTVSPVPSGAGAVTAAPPPPSFAPGRDMKCWFLGFDTGAAQRVIPPAARMR